MVTGFLPITPRPAERARRGKGHHMFNSDSYIKYKADLALSINSLKLESGNYVFLEATFFIPYATKIKVKTNGELHRSRPDCDNYMKALKDALSACQIFSREIGKGKSKKISYDDSMISAENGLKVKINDPIGGIYFALLTEPEYIRIYGSPADKFFLDPRKD